MYQSQHRRFNTLLNNLKTSTTPSQSSSPFDYEHLYLVDNFYTDSPGDSREKIRVTRDEKTSTVVQCVKKIRLGDLNIYSPKRAADWRVSVSLEVPGEESTFANDVLKRPSSLTLIRSVFLVSHPLGSPSYSRRKDRMRYTHEEFVIDLTQVTMQPSPSAPVRCLWVMFEVVLHFLLTFFSLVQTATAIT